MALIWGEDDALISSIGAASSIPLATFGSWWKRAMPARLQGVSLALIA